MRKCCSLQSYSQQCSERRCSLQSSLQQCSEDRCSLQSSLQQCCEKRCSLQSCSQQCSEKRCSLHDFRDADASFISPALLFAPVFSFGGNSVRIANEGHSPEEHPG